MLEQIAKSLQNIIGLIEEAYQVIFGTIRGEGMPSLSSSGRGEIVFQALASGVFPTKTLF